MNEQYIIEKEEKGSIVIISCVGQRPLAVINPINTLIVKKGFKAGETSVILFTTDETETHGIDCRAWFEERFHGVKVSLMPFRQNGLGERIDRITDGAAAIYFNASPGMNWEIASVAACLPDRSICIYADYAKLYIWQIKDDIKNAESIGLLDMGIETYSRFSNKKFYEKEGINDGLSENLKILLNEHGYNKHYMVEGTGIPLNGEITDFIKRRLVWARETAGYIYLLFDFQVGAPLMQNNTEEQKIQNRYYLNMYRAITKIFNPVNFTVAITTDNATLKERAKVDGVISIFYSPKRKAVWETEIMALLESTTKIAPKGVVNVRTVSKYTTSPANLVKGLSPAPLIVCLGDNIDTTLTAIYSHNRKDVFMFYDASSPRITYFAEKIKTNLKNFVIKLLPTDNVGSGIMSQLEILCKDSERLDINITPGTKSQLIALVQAAKKLGKADSLYSIDKDSIKKLTDPSFSSGVTKPEIDVIINCHMAPYKGSTNIPDVPAFLSVMGGLAQGSIRPAGIILDIKNIKGEPIFQKKTSISLENYCELTCKLDGKIYKFDNDFVDPEKQKTGIWWEAVVAYTLRHSLKQDVIWSAEWSWPGTKLNKKASRFTEIDAVFRFNNSICAVSCKTGLMSGLKDTTKYEIKSEAEKRFGRFALPFVAIPFDNHKGRQYAGIIEDDVMYLTPSLMIDSVKLNKAIEDFAQSKSTFCSGSFK